MPSKIKEVAKLETPYKSVRSSSKLRKRKQIYSFHITGQRFILISVIFLLASSLICSGSRRFLTGLIIGTLIARNGQQSGYSQYQQSYPSYQPPPSYPSSQSNSNQPLLIIIPTASSSKGSSYKQSQPASYPAETFQPPPPPPAPPTYQDRASRRRMTSQLKSSTETRGLIASQRKILNRFLPEPYLGGNKVRLSMVPPVNHQSPYLLLEPHQLHLNKRRSSRSRLHDGTDHHLRRINARRSSNRRQLPQSGTQILTHGMLHENMYL